jgi:hypothetical protein
MQLHWKTKRTLAKIFLYEYWPFFVFFMPMIPFWLYQAIRSRSLVYFTAVNPSIFLSGLFGESKKEILQNIDNDYLPKSIYLKSSETAQSILTNMSEKNLDFPIVLKPDVGERGNQVSVIKSENELAQYLEKNGSQDLILQEYLTQPIELGVFYFKFPDGSGSGISSVTGKEFLTVVGDGISNIEKLIKNHLRASMQYERLISEKPESLSKVPAYGEKVVLENIGNHCKGTKFLNYNGLINEKLVKVFDKIAENHHGFYFGRYDLKVNSIEELYEGHTIKIMELNGVTSEPAHIYDPSYNLLFAYRDIIKNMAICAKIARINHKKGIIYNKPKEIYVYLKNHFNGNAPHVKQSNFGAIAYSNN